MQNKKYQVTVLRRKFQFEEPKPIQVEAEMKDGWIDANNDRFQVGDIIIDKEHNEFQICLQITTEDGTPWKYVFKLENNRVVLNDTHDPRDEVRHAYDEALILKNDRIKYLSDITDTIEKFAEQIFHHTNCPVEIDPKVERPYHGRSLSVGDAVTKDGKIAICASCGWTVYDSKDLGTRIMELGQKKLAGA